MLGRLHVRFMDVIVRPIKVFTPQRMSMVIVFAVHNAKVLSIVASYLFDTHSLWWFRMNWLAHLPIIFICRVEIVILFLAVRRRFINILELVGMLPLSTRLIKILFKVEMRFIIIFTWHYMEVVDPLIMLRLTISRFVAKCRMENASWTALKTWWRILGIVLLSVRKWLAHLKGDNL